MSRPSQAVGSNIHSTVSTPSQACEWLGQSGKNTRDSEIQGLVLRLALKIQGNQRKLDSTAPMLRMTSIHQLHMHLRRGEICKD